MGNAFGPLSAQPRSRRSGSHWGGHEKGEGYEWINRYSCEITDPALLFGCPTPPPNASPNALLEYQDLVMHKLVSLMEQRETAWSHSENIDYDAYKRYEFSLAHEDEQFMETQNAMRQYTDKYKLHVIRSHGQQRDHLCEWIENNKCIIHHLPSEIPIPNFFSKNYDAQVQYFFQRLYFKEACFLSQHSADIREYVNEPQFFYDGKDSKKIKGIADRWNALYKATIVHSPAHHLKNIHDF